MPRSEPDHLVDANTAAAYVTHVTGRHCAPGTIWSWATRGHIGRYGRGRYDIREIHTWTEKTLMDDLVTWLRAQLDQDELWALAASAPYHGDGPTVAGGLHWTWAVGDNWDPVDVDPTVSYVGEPYDTVSVTLVTREDFPLDWDPRGLNGKVLCAEEMRTGDAGHIVRWDPARVLAEVDAKRRIIAAHGATGSWPKGCETCVTCGAVPGGYVKHPCDTLRLLALPYAGRPGYRDEWRPERGDLTTR